MNEVFTVPNFDPNAQFPANANVPAVRQNAGNAVSCFDDFETFQQVFEMARCLSKSRLVPAAFQNSPESCVIAIDLARRLGVAPLTLFPHLYVVDSKPAFSTQFLITLVNRSGQFNRLEWQTGTDGDATVRAFLRWNEKTKEIETTETTVPNVWAIAKLVERRTGKEFLSPRVDMVFADKNGWTAKRGSKWLTMPEIMASYRAASILIKRVCPELTLGLDFAEDVADAIEPEPTRTVYTEPRIPEPAGGSEIDLVAVYTKKIAEAANAGALETVAAEIARAGLTGDARDRVADAFRNRRDEIDRQRNETVVSGYLERIKQAKTKEELGEIYQNFEGERMVLEYRQTVYSAIDARSEEIEQQQGAKAK